MNKKMQLKVGAIISYASIALSVVLGIFYTPTLVNKLGEADYSIYTIAISIISVFLLDFGLSNSVTKYMSEYFAKDEKEKAEQFYGKINQLYFILDALLIIVFTVYFFILPSVYSALDVGSIERLKVVFIILSIYNLIAFAMTPLEGIITASEHFIFLKVIQLIVKIAPAVFTIILLSIGCGLYSLVLTQVVIGVFAIVLKKLYVAKRIRVKPTYAKYNFREYYSIFTYTFWVALIQIGSKLLLALFPTILGMTSGSYDITVFGIIHTLESYVSTIAYALSALLLPRVTRIMIEEKDDKKLNDLFVKTAKVQTLICGLVIIGFSILGNEFISIWMKRDYSEAYFGLLLLIIPICSIQTICVGTSALHVRNKIKPIGICYLCCGLLNLIFSYVLSLSLGVLGVCISFFLFETFIYLFILFTVKKNTNIRIINVLLKVYIPSFVNFLLTFAVFVSIKSFNPVENITRLAIYIFSITLFYMLIAGLLNFKDTRSLISSVFRGKKNR